jgi:hypothetical protein
MAFFTLSILDESGPGKVHNLNSASEIPRVQNCHHS